MQWKSWLLLGLAACGPAQAAPVEDEVNPVQLLQHFLRKDSHERWVVLGADGRVLDVNENQANFVGQSVQLAPPVSNNTENVRNILNARSRVPRNPENITISLGVDVPGGFETGVFVIPQADITWGCGGALNKARIDVVKGTHITVAANVLTVDGVYFAPFFGNTTRNLRMSANLAYGTRGGSNVAPGFTQIGTVVKNGNNTDFTIPNFAKDVTVYSTQIVGGGFGAPADLSIFFISDDTVPSTAAQGTIVQNQGTAPNTVFALTYPIPGYARKITVRNNTVANDAAVTLRYGLAL